MRGSEIIQFEMIHLHIALVKKHSGWHSSFTIGDMLRCLVIGEEKNTYRM